LLGLLGLAAGRGDLLFALSLIAGATGAIALCDSGTDDRPLAAARAAATSDVLVPVASATRVGETSGAIAGGPSDGDLDFVESSGMFKALLTLSSSISTSSSTPDGPAPESSRLVFSILILLLGSDCDCFAEAEATLEPGLLSKKPGIGSPKVSCGLGAESRKRGSCPARLDIVGGVGEGADRDGPGDALRVAGFDGVGGMIFGVEGIPFLGEVVLAFFSGLVRRVLGPELGVWVGRPESRLRFFSFSLSLPFTSLGSGLVGGSIFPFGALPSVSLFLFFFFFFFFVLSGEGTATISSSSNRVASSGFTSSLTFFARQLRAAGTVLSCCSSS